MEEVSGWKLWPKYIFESSKTLGNKIITGVKNASIYVADKTKEGATYMAEITKPTTEKINHGMGYIGTQFKNTFDSVKNKISGEKAENINSDINNNNINNDSDNNENKLDLLGKDISSNYSQINS